MTHKSSLLLLLSAGFLLASCGGGNESADSSTAESTASVSNEGTSAESTDTEESSESTASGETTESTDTEESIESTGTEESIESTDTEESTESTDTEASSYVLAIQESEHSTTVVKDAAEQVVTAVSPNEWYTLHISFEEGYTIKSVKLSYKKVSYDSTVTYNENLTPTHEDDSISFKVETPSKDAPITITVEEISTTAFADASFIGSYIGFRTWNLGVKSVNAFDSKERFTVAASGVIDFPGWEITTSFSSFTGETEGRIQTAGGVWKYGDNIILGSRELNKDIYTYDASDYLIGIKKENAADADEDYEIAADLFRISDVYYLSVQALRNGEAYGSLFTNLGVGESHAVNIFGAGFSFQNGTRVTDVKALYSVGEDGTSEYVVGSINTGGPSDRVFVTGPYGHYTVGDKPLFLDGISHATYDGTPCDYTVDGNTVTLTAGTREIVITLGENRTATLVSDQEVQGNTFRGHAYFGAFTCKASGSWYGEAYYVYIAFDATNDTFVSRISDSRNGALNGSGILYFNGSTNFYDNTAQTAYTYDEATYTVSATVIDGQNKSGKAFSMVYSPLEDTFRITSSNWSTSIYTFSNETLSLYQ